MADMHIVDRLTIYHIKFQTKKDATLHIPDPMKMQYVITKSSGYNKYLL